MRYVSYLIGLLIFTNTVWAMSLEDLAAQMEKQPLVRADFTQIKTINGLTKPFKSSGNMLVTKQYGLYWHQQQPFSILLILTTNKMVQVINDQQPQIITAQSNPQMFQFNYLLTAIFNADRAVLEKNFSLKLEGSPGLWWLTLTPIASPLDKIFKQLKLTGGEFLETIEIDDMQGDQTMIKFTNQTTKPALTAEELKYFAP